MDDEYVWGSVPYPSLPLHVRFRWRHGYTVRI